ncbi:MAG: hypothetical protein ACM3VT_13130 [Solirubrobacterales bacterium]
MKLSIVGACALAVLFWTAGQSLAQGQGQGKGQGKPVAPSTTEVAKPAQSLGNGVQGDKPMNTAGKEGKKAVEGVDAKAKEMGKDMQGKASDAMEKGKGKGKDHQGQLQAFDKQARHDQGKHMERQARLARIRELAVQKNDQEMIARVDKLIAKEQQVYGRKQLRIKGPKTEAGQSQTPGQQAPITTPEQQAPTTTPATPPTEVQPSQTAPSPNAPTK